VVRLQQVRDFPCASMLMSTAPARRMRLTDQTRLEDLRDQAMLRLRRVSTGPPVGPLVASLNRLTHQVAQEPTGRGLALYVGGRTASALRLGVPVPDRVVLDETFAARDLVLSLQRTPRHVVLLLSWREARLVDAVNDQLHPGGTAAFPFRTAGRGSTTAMIRERAIPRSRSSSARSTPTWHVSALDPSPLVLVAVRAQ